MRRSLSLVLILLLTGLSFAQSVKIGPRISGNLNIWNAKGLTGTWNGVGVGIGGTIDVSFSPHIGLMTNLTFFDMRNFSNSITQNQTTQETSLSLSYVSVDPMFKAEFSGFYMLAGPSLGIKITSSGERTTAQTGATPNVQTINIETKSIRFDIATGVGYTFTLSPGMYMGTDFIAYIPITDTYNLPGNSNSVFSLKLGVSLKFGL